MIYKKEATRTLTKTGYTEWIIEGLNINEGQEFTYKFEFEREMTGRTIRWSKGTDDTVVNVMTLAERPQSGVTYTKVATEHGVAAISLWVFESADLQEVKLTITSIE